MAIDKDKYALIHTSHWSIKPGDQHYLKYTVEVTVSILDKLLEYLDRDKNCVFIGTACVNCGVYTKLPRKLIRRYIENEEVYEKGSMVYSILEERLVRFGLMGTLNANLVKFSLQHIHKWREGVSQGMEEDDELAPVEQESAQITGQETVAVLSTELLARMEAEIIAHKGGQERDVDTEYEFVVE